MLNLAKVTSDYSSMVLDLRSPTNGVRVTSIDGLGPLKSTISVVEATHYIGTRYAGSDYGNRNIVFHIRYGVGGVTPLNVELNKFEIYKLFPPGKYIQLVFNTSSREGFIYGYVESTEPNPFSSEPTIDVSILCMYPYFRATGQANLVNFPGGSDFIISNGDATIKSPAKVVISFLSTYTQEEGNQNLIPEFTIVQNGTTIADISINMARINAAIDRYPKAGDTITINTDPDNRSVYIQTTDAAGYAANIMSAVAYEGMYPVWPDVPPGSSTAKLDLKGMSVEDFSVSIEWSTIYEAMM